MVALDKLVSDLVVRAQRHVGSTFYPPDSGDVRLDLRGCRLAPGLFIMPGATGSGKSTNALAIALELGQKLDILNYYYVMEPRAAAILMDQFKNAQLIHETMDRTLARFAGSESPYLVMDSLTYIIPAIGLHALEGQEDVTMAGGLRRSEILGVLMLDANARRYGVTLIGTINSELFPRPQALEGACEGALEIEAVGRLYIRDRGNRTKRPLNLSTATVHAARRLLGQGVSSDDDSSPLTQAFI